MDLGRSGNTLYTEISLCPEFFRGGFMKPETLPTFGINFKRVFLMTLGGRLLRGQRPNQDFKTKDAGA